MLGKLIAASSIASLVAYSFLWVGQNYLGLSYKAIYLPPISSLVGAYRFEAGTAPKTPDSCLGCLRG